MMKHWRNLIFGLITLGVFLLIFTGMTLPAKAVPLRQAYDATNTPLPDGRIFHIVREGDSCLGIAAFYNINVTLLRQLNNLGANGCSYLQPGQQLLIGLATSNTVVPTFIATPATPTPTPLPVKAEVCIILFNDVNGNAVLDPGEAPIANGVVSLTDRTGQVSMTGKTTAEVDTTGAIINSLCFENVPDGDYNISLAIPEGYNTTTSMNAALKVVTNGQMLLDFGAQYSSLSMPVTTTEGGTDVLLGLIGGAFLLAGIGLAIYRYIQGRSQ